MLQALNEIRSERDRTVNYIAGRWKIDHELAAQSYDIMVRSFSKDGSASAKSIQNVIDSTRSRLQIDRAISVNDVAAFSLLGEVQRETTLK